MFLIEWCRAVFVRHPAPELYKGVTVLALILLVSLATTRMADGEVPSGAAFAACNAAALYAVKPGNASPTMADHARAGSARGAAMATNSTDFTASAIESANPQIHGLAAEGAKNAMYQAAYRRCMRQKGF